MSRTISGTSTAGITLSSTIDNPVSVTGAIDVTSGTALYGTGGGSYSWTIGNSGLISGGGSGYGISLGTTAAAVSNGFVTNEAGGTIAGGYTGLAIWGPGSVTNMAGGTITGGSYNKGVYIKGAGSVVNAGLIAAGNVAVYADAGGSVTNLATGTIAGAGGVSFYNAVGTFTNAGVVIGTSGGVGAVSFYYNSTANRLIADPGAVFDGNVFGGAGVLELAVGNGYAGSLSGLGGAITQFTTLQFDPGVQWTLVGDTAGLAGTVTIDGFTGNDTIDLTGFAAVSETFASNALVLTDAGSAHVTLEIQGTFASGDFQLASYGADGTKITQTPRTFSWTGGSGNWNTPGNWDLASVPTSVDIVVNAEAGSNTVTIAAGAVNAIANLTLGAASDTLQVNGRLNVAGTLAINAGTLTDIGSLSAATITDNALLAFVGSHTLDNTPLALGGTLQVRNAGTQSTLTLGSGEVITQAGTTATINSTGSNGETVINNGAIDAAVGGGTMTIAPLNLMNQGIISAGSSEALSIGGAWSNSGIIALSGAASLNLGGSFKTAGIGTITGATNVNLTGALDNTKATLNVGAGTELGTVNLANAASVTGGIIADHGNGFTFNRNGMFDGVTYEGTLDIASYEGMLNIVNGLTVTGAGGSGPGTINLSVGGDAILNFEGSQTIDNATINLNGTDSFNPLTEINIGGGSIAVLTLGPNLTVSSTAAGTQADIRSDLNNYTAVVNQGTISAAANGGSFSISPVEGFTNQGTISLSNGEYFSVQPGFGTFDNIGIVSVAGGSTLQIEDSSLTPPISNAGTITMANGTTLDLAGYFTPASLGTLVNHGATTLFDGTFDGQNGTITLGAGTEFNQVLLSGNLRNATVIPNGDFTIVSPNASLQNVTFEGQLDVTGDYTSLTIYQGVTATDSSGTQPGTMDITGQQDTLIFADQYPGTTQTLDNVTLNIGNSTIADTMQPSFYGGTFTIGANADIDSATAGALVTLDPGGGTTVILNGTLSAIAAGGTFTVSGTTSGYFMTTFNNNGTIIVGNGDTLRVNAPIVAGSGNGTIDVGTGGIVNVQTFAVASDQTLAFTDATGMLQLAQASSFAASIAGFTTGNTLDLVNTAADNAIWTAGTSGAPGKLAITDGGTAVATLSLLGDYTGIGFNVTSDKSGGSDIAVTLACYAEGTRILTPRGDIAIEQLRAGDEVLTVSGAARSIRWIGHRRIDLRRHPDKRRVMPIRIVPHAFGEGRPRRALILSPDHAVFVENVLIPIKYLVDGVSVTPVRCAAVTYYHIELPRHDVMLAEGMPAESYLEVGGRDAFANGGRVMRLHPDFHPPSDHCAMMWETRGYAPLVVVGETLDRVRQALACQTAMRESARPRARPKRQVAKAA